MNKFDDNAEVKFVIEAVKNPEYRIKILKFNFISHIILTVVMSMFTVFSLLYGWNVFVYAILALISTGLFFSLLTYANVINLVIYYFVITYNLMNALTFMEEEQIFDFLKFFPEPTRTKIFNSVMSVKNKLPTNEKEQ